MNMKQNEMPQVALSANAEQWKQFSDKFSSRISEALGDAASDMANIESILIDQLATKSGGDTGAVTDGMFDEVITSGREMIRQRNLPSYKQN